MQSLKYLCILVWHAHLCVLETLVKKGKDNTVKLQNKKSRVPNILTLATMRAKHKTCEEFCNTVSNDMSIECVSALPLSCGQC